MSSYPSYAYNLLMIQLEDEVNKLEKEIEERYKEIPDFFDFGEPDAYDGDKEVLNIAFNKLMHVKKHIYDDDYKKALFVFKSIDL